MTRLSRLDLDWRTRPPARGQAAREFLDFVVDGRSLQDTLDLGAWIGCFGWRGPKDDRRCARELLLRQASEWSSGRSALYICAECGDLGCGAVTVHVEKADGGFMWTAFRLESTATRDVKDIEGGPFHFYRVDYVNALARF